jgi:hypothetical protein
MTRSTDSGARVTVFLEKSRSDEIGIFGSQFTNTIALVLLLANRSRGEAAGVGDHLPFKRVLVNL